MSVVVFQVKGIAPTSWKLRQNGVMAYKKDSGLKFINYYKGQDSIFEEDITNKDIKASRVPDFTFNMSRNKTELVVNKQDTALINYLKAHPDFNKGFEIYSEEIESQKKLTEYEKKEKALEYIKESNEVKFKALALAYLGYDYFGKDYSTLSAKLKEMAFESPDKILSERESGHFENKYISALAFCSEVVKSNSSYTSIVWTEGEGKILEIAQGENAIEKLSRFLLTKTAESEALLKEVMKRTDYEKIKVVYSEVEVEEMTLDEAREKYIEKFSKELPPAQKNNIGWIKSKLIE